MISAIETKSPAEQLQELYEKFVEPELLDPCFVTQVPSVIIPLAKKNANDPFFADVYELAINGVEISPGYTELNARLSWQVTPRSELNLGYELNPRTTLTGTGPSAGTSLTSKVQMLLLGYHSTF